MVLFSQDQQYPPIRALKTCLCCGGKKDIGCLVCWDCHNALKMTHEGGYGPTMERVLSVANAQFEITAQSLKRDPM